MGGFGLRLNTTAKSWQGGVGEEGEGVEVVDVVGDQILMNLMESSQTRWASACLMAQHWQLHVPLAQT